MILDWRQTPFYIPNLGMKISRPQNPTDTASGQFPLVEVKTQCICPDTIACRGSQACKAAPWRDLAGVDLFKARVLWGLYSQPSTLTQRHWLHALCCPNAQRVKPHFESVSQTDNEVVTQCRTVIEMDWVKKNFSGYELRYVYKSKQQSLIKLILWSHSQSVFPAWLETGIF